MGSRAHATTSAGRRGALPALQLAAAGNSSSSAAILELLVWMGCCRTGGFCFGGLDSSGERRLLLERANSLAASFGVGVAWFGS